MLSTSSDVTFAVEPKTPSSADAVAVFVTQGAKDAGVPQLSEVDQRAAARLLSAGVVSGKAKELAFDLVDADGDKKGRGKHRRVYVIGLGPAEKVTTETIRQASGHLAKALRKHKLYSAVVALPAVESVPASLAAEAIVTGLALARFRFREYKGAAQKKDDYADNKKSLAVTILSGDASIRRSVERAKTIADGQNFARTIASRPGNNINPPTLAKVASQLAKEVGLGIRVLDEKQMLKLGMGGILAVGSGSASPPRMIALDWQGQGARGKGQGKKSPRSPLLVVGKSITFDTGGISIKPADKMGDMIFDKCGGMAVLGLMYAVARLKLPIHVVGILTSAENMPGSRAYRPGDILRMYNGVTVEVTNTDAEGRLVLADALSWGIKTYKPSAVIDLATLTGGVVVALGSTMAGVMANNDDLVAELQKAADSAGEKIWRLPVGDDQREQIKSDPADIVNSAGRQASPLQGGAFLSHFVPKDHNGDDSVPWAHLDIAGVADTEKELPLYAKGATGWGVRTLVEWVSGRINATTHATPRPAGG
jgi:leucyl aminopeptidase